MEAKRYAETSAPTYHATSFHVIAEHYCNIQRIEKSLILMLFLTSCQAVDWLPFTAKTHLFSPQEMDELLETES
jgi:hypothetical protein